MIAITRGRQTVTVVRSAPQACVVCEGRKRVALVAGAMPTTGADARRATTRCPHCQDHLPAIYLPFRADTPSRGGAA